MDSQSGSVGLLTDGVVSQRGMLAQLAARLRASQGGAGDGGGEVILGEDGEAVLLDDNCTVSIVGSSDDPGGH